MILTSDGTLLGHIRDGFTIKYDYDVDFMCFDIDMDLLKKIV